MKRLLILLLCLVACPLCADLSYEVQFLGVEESDTEELLKSASQLIALQECPPSTTIALQRRAEAEIPRIVKALHSRAFFDAEVTLDVDFKASPAQVIFKVDTGPAYPLAAFHILAADEMGIDEPVIEPNDKRLDDEVDALETDWLAREDGGEEEVQPVPYELPDAFLAYDSIDTADLSIELGSPASPQAIIDGEEALLDYLDSIGYPLATIAKREIVADQKSKQVEVWLYVHSGPLAYFGKTVVSGLKRVREAFVLGKVKWCEGQPYDPELLQRTFDALDNSGLFLNIQVTPGEYCPDTDRVPIEIQLSEARHRSIGFGGSYTTQWGGGVVAEWEHRNVRGMGERVALKTELMQRLQSITASYLKPDFLCVGQDLLTRFEAEREITEGFHDTSFMLSSRVSHRITPALMVSSGLALKYLTSTDSDNNHHFTLAKTPFQALYNDTGCPLDPIRGYSLNLKFIPTFGIIGDQKPNYAITTLDAALYRPLNSSESLVFAGKASFGSILGTSRINVPPPERFYAGSPQLLRGYRYLTVSPLNAQNKPIGGRSLMVFSFELRQRFGADWGGVVFYEVGNVYAQTLPQFDHKQLQSVGFGVRYYTAVGPLRLDIAFPLNRRPAVDGRVQVYFNIGQTF